MYVTENGNWDATFSGERDTVYTQKLSCQTSRALVYGPGSGKYHPHKIIKIVAQVISKYEMLKYKLG